MTAALVFPHQIFEDNPLLSESDHFYLIEDPLLFKQYSFHKSKLVLHRASMKFYASILAGKKKQVHYVSSDQANLVSLLQELSDQKYEKVIVIDPTDYLLERRLKRESQRSGLKLQFVDNPNFLTSKGDLKTRLKKGKSGYLMANFYKTQREELDILIDNGEPTGGQWSFDEDNRKKLPKNIDLPKVIDLPSNDWVKEAKEYVDRNFNDNLGGMDQFNYPVTHEEAEAVLEDFLDNRMKLFGDYEDAIAKGQSILFHSVLTPALNIGLLTPRQVLDKTFEIHRDRQFPLNCLEGFVRQIIGWREFMRGIYEFEGVFERTNNHFGHTRKIPQSFYDGTTGIVPIDQTVKKVLKFGYCHHIERLMLLGNFMLLCEFDPDEIYRWFMELFIDAYDWVMVPNVYGMTQYADGGLITTKPYVSSSNYVLKMSDYKKGDWCKYWDGLYWKFIFTHKEDFSKNQRMSFMTAMLDKMKPEKLEQHLENADKFLSELDT